MVFAKARAKYRDAVLVPDCVKDSFNNNYIIFPIDIQIIKDLKDEPVSSLILYPTHDEKDTEVQVNLTI